MDLPISGAARDEIARILEQAAKEGLDHPRNLDAAIDAIGAALQCEAITRVVYGWSDNETSHFLPEHQTLEEVLNQMGDGVKIGYTYAIKKEVE